MKTSSLLVASALAAAVGLPAAFPQDAAAQSGPAAKPDFKFEKCYGIVKAGHNDCQTANSSCAGTAKRDMQADAWVYLPMGACQKIAGGNLEPKKS